MEPAPMQTKTAELSEFAKPAVSNRSTRHTRLNRSAGLSALAERSREASLPSSGRASGRQARAWALVLAAGTAVSMAREARGDDYPDACAEATDLGTASLIRGQIENPGDRDWFRITLPAGRELELVLDGVTNVDIRTTDCSGLLGNQTQDLPERLPVMPTGGSVSVGVYNELALSGAYQLRIIDRGPRTDDHPNSPHLAQTPFPMDVAVTAQFDYVRDADIWQLPFGPGIYAVHTNETGDLNPANVFPSVGFASLGTGMVQELGRSDSLEPRRMTRWFAIPPGFDGPAFLSVGQGNWQRYPEVAPDPIFPVRYQVRAERIADFPTEDSNPTDCVAAAPIASGEIVTGLHSADERDDWFTIPLVPDRLYSFARILAGPLARISLFDSSCNETLAGNPDNPGFAQARSVENPSYFRVPQAIDGIVRARLMSDSSSNDSPYAFVLEDLGPIIDEHSDDYTQATLIEPGSLPTVATLCEVDQDAFAIDLQSNQVYTLTFESLTPGELIQAWLLDESGALAEILTFGVEPVSRQILGPDAGTRRVHLWLYGIGGFQNYRLTVGAGEPIVPDGISRACSSPTPIAAFGVPTPIVVRGATDVPFIGFNAIDGHRYRVELDDQTYSGTASPIVLASGCSLYPSATASGAIPTCFGLREFISNQNAFVSVRPVVRERSLGGPMHVTVRDLGPSPQDTGGLNEHEPMLASIGRKPIYAGTEFEDDADFIRFTVRLNKQYVARIHSTTPSTTLDATLRKHPAASQAYDARIITNDSNPGWAKREFFAFGAGLSNYQLTIQPRLRNCGSSATGEYCLVVHNIDCPADWDGDGVTDISDLLNYVQEWQTLRIGADEDLDGAVDLADLVQFLVKWQNGCVETF